MIPSRNTIRTTASRFPRTIALAKSLPVLAQADGIEPFDPAALDAWAVAAEQDGRIAALFSARFVLHVFDCRRKWACGRFDLMPAMRAWDDLHQAAFRAWAAHPFQE